MSRYVVSMCKHTIFDNTNVGFKTSMNDIDNNITDIVNEGKFDHCEGNFDQLMVGNLDHLLDVHLKNVCYKINCT